MTALDRSIIHQQSSSFVAARKAAQDLLGLYAEAGVTLSPQCSLGQLIAHAISLADDWEAGTPIDDDAYARIILGQHLDKIAWAALPLADDPNRAQHLADLRRGSLDPHSRAPSLAKDKLWELELCRQFNDLGIPSVLAEPDIVATTPMGEIAIACKRIYSEKNATKPFSQGVKQIESTGLPGILAISIEDLVIPPDQIVTAPTIQIAAHGLNELNRNFINHFHSTLLRYVSTGRVSSVAVSTGAPVYLDDEGIRDCRQTQFWTHPDLNAEKKQQMESIANRLFGDAP
ncbi:hypothetical protein [Pseudoxanthomonas winnipegensis]|uniref:hypothetical protein n=1 Tax=Pseudoxanthomonas winnipegensis TaxID=2480810 RepID=UPI00103DE4E9|nr:hypothetical protein [Pseudoxanthomonas winnipegensis]TBV69762.1 hypothetical protein EYC45_19125 [Pseudoxanthomonas winnipegensis]